MVIDRVSQLLKRHFLALQWVWPKGMVLEGREQLNSPCLWWLAPSLVCQVFILFLPPPPPNFLPASHIGTKLISCVFCMRLIEHVWPTRKTSISYWFKRKHLVLMKMCDLVIVIFDHIFLIRYTFMIENLVWIQRSLPLLLDDSKVHGVIIATVTSSHEELVVKSLNAGKAVFCEKPLAETYDGTG